MRLNDKAGHLKYRPDIDGLRALAVLSVILFHLGSFGFGGGFAGVDIFFVISGYLIAAIMRKDMESGNFSIAHFYERRIRRILPALFLVMAMTLVPAVIILLPGELTFFAKSMTATALFSSNILFWYEAGYFAPQSASKPLLHTWSLGVEEQFYIVFPLLLFLLYRLGRGWAVRVLAGLCLLSLLLSLWTTQKAPENAFFLAPGRAWELLAGSLLALTALRAPTGRASEIVCLAGLCLAVLAVLTPWSIRVFPAPAAALPVAGALLILWGGNDSKLGGGILRAGPMVALGRMSYSAYLWHWPLIAFLTYYLVRPLRPLEGLAVLTCTLVLSAFSWRYVEMPARRAAMHRRLVFGAAAAGTLLFAALGAVGYFYVGFPDRFPAIPAFDYRKNFHLGTCFLLNQKAEEWSGNRCIYPGAADAPLAVLWGDSYAAHYMPGLQSAQARLSYALEQATMSRCPPLLGERVTDPSCQLFNLRVLTDIRRRRPKLVILSADWATHDQALVAAGLSRTLARLQEAGIRALILGQVPVYYSDVARIDHMLRLRGQAAQWFTPKSDFSEDVVLARLASAHGAEFFAPRKILCSGDKCRFSDGALFEFDIGHLTDSGSRYVVNRLEPVLALSLAGPRAFAPTHAKPSPKGRRD